MPARDPNAVAKKWADNLSAAANNGTVAAGIDAVTVAPGQAAARQKDVWVQNTTAAKDRWAAASAAVPLESWKSSAKNKGVARIGSGAAEAQPAMANFMGKLLNNINTAKASLQPRGTFQQNLTRANQMATALHQTKGSYK